MIVAGPALRQQVTRQLRRKSAGCRQRQSVLASIARFVLLPFDLVLR
jgi:hypothetical protein